jgi:hypothetical protein
MAFEPTKFPASHEHRAAYHTFRLVVIVTARLTVPRTRLATAALARPVVHIALLATAALTQSISERKNAPVNCNNRIRRPKVYANNGTTVFRSLRWHTAFAALD